MRHINKYRLLCQALVLGALLTTIAVDGQTPVGIGTSEWAPGGMNISNGTIRDWLTEGSTSGFLVYTGNTHQQEWNNSFSYRRNGASENAYIGTFNLCNGSDHFKMLVPAKREGTISVYYVPTRTVTHNLDVSDLGPGWGSKSNNGNTVTWNETWSAYTYWTADLQVKPTKVTLVVNGDNGEGTPKVYIQLNYSSGADDSNCTSTTADGKTTISINVDPERKLNQFYVHNEAPGTTIFESISFDYTATTPDPIIKSSTSDDFAGATVLTTSKTTGNPSVITYDYYTTADTYFYVSNSQIGVIKVTSAEAATRLPEAVNTITDNEIWESQGTGQWSQLRPLNNPKVWLSNSPTNAGGQDSKVIVNGDDSHYNGDNNCNTSILNAEAALGFRLKANSKFRIQVFCDKTNLDATKMLKTGGSGLENSSYVSGGYVTEIKGVENGQPLESDTRLVTYDITTSGSDQVYWISPGSGDVKVGAVQILIDNQVTTTANSILTNEIYRTTTYNLYNTAANRQVKSDIDGSYTVNFLNSGTRIRSTDGSSTIYAYSVGPSMAFNATANSVMMNNGNAICIGKVPQYGTVTVNYISDPGAGLLLKTGATREGATQVSAGATTGGFGSVTWANTSTDAQYVWIEANNTSYVYLTDFNVKMRKPPMTYPIDGDFIWRSRADEDIPENTTFEGGYLFNYNDVETAQATEMVVNGTSVPTRDLTGEDDYIAFRIANDKKGKIRIYYTGGAPTLTRGNDFANATTAVTGTTKKSNENGAVGNIVDDYVVYDFIASDAKYYKLKGNIAGIQVLMDDPVSGDLNAINGDMSLWVTDNLGTTISKGAAKLVVNRQSYLDENGYSKYNGTTDATLNSHQVNDRNSIQISGSETVSYKFAPGSYKVTFYADKDLSDCGIYIQTSGVTNAKVDNGNAFANADGKEQGFGNIGTRYITFDVASGSEGVVTFSSWGGTTYFAGIEVESTKDKMQFVTAGQPGIFTGRYKGKLLIYCTDNGTLESYRVPKANYIHDNATVTDDITTTPIFQLVKQHYDTSKGSAPGTLQIVADGSYYKVTGFEDTDIDQLYKVIYRNGQDGEDYYYLWYSNYLKTGWWTGHDAKLIVGTDDSSTDPDNIIVGEFYVSSGSKGTLYFEAPDETGFSGVDYVYTADNNTTAMRNIAKATSDNDKANEDAINLAWPTPENMPKWTGDVTKFVEFAAHRTNQAGTIDNNAAYYDWPDFTIKLTFHFVPAPAMTMTAGTGSNTVAFTTYNGTKEAVAGQTVYYTTDGTRPNGNSAQSQGGQSVTNTFSATYYAAERITTARQFYKVNPYTTHIEGKTPYELMTSGDNKTNEFYAISSVCYSPVTDLKVDYIDINTGYLTHATNYTGGTAFDGTVLTGKGGTQYNYPVGSTASNRQMTVKFGNTDLKALQGGSFEEGGVSWSLQGQLQYPFSEHLDCMQYDNNITNQLQGYNDGSYNGDPRTECNGGVGGAWTDALADEAPDAEDKVMSMFLTPITGDFLRFEPEYDGVITLWIRQNGSGQGNEIANGDLTRRPVYIMDENGKLMKRSTIRPTSEHFFGIDGVYAEIDEVKSNLRMDFHSAWLRGLDNWDNLSDYNKAAYRLYNVYYGLPLFQRHNFADHNSAKNRYTFDIADSWVSRTANVESVVCDYNPIYYRSNQAMTDLENEIYFDDVVNGNTTSHQTDKTVNKKSNFAKYGWELPTYNVVRYRFPVRAGKTYYVAGRGTKNGFVAVKLDPLPVNYASTDYIHGHNQVLSETSFDAQTLTAAGKTAGTKATDTYNATTNLATYDNTTDPNHNLAMYTMWNHGQNRQYYGVLHPDYVGKTKHVRLTQRTFSAGNWYGIVLPFSVSETKMKEIFGEDVKVLYIDPYKNSIGHTAWNNPWISVINPGVDYIDNNPNNGLTLKLTHHCYQMLYANTPCFICPSRTVEDPDFGDVTIEMTNTGRNTYQASVGLNGYENLGYKIGETTDYEYFVTGSYYQFHRTADNQLWYNECTEEGASTVTFASRKFYDDADMYYIDNYKNGVTEENQAVFYHAVHGVGLNGTRAWVEARPKPSSSGAPGRAPVLSTVGFNTFDGIDENNYGDAGICDIIADEDQIDFVSTDENVYDVMGRVVAVGSTSGLPDGVYIFKGKKVYVRN